MGRTVEAFERVNDNITKPVTVNLDTADIGLGAVPGTLASTCVATELGDSALHKTVFTCTAVPVVMTDEAGVVQHGGAKIYDFPAGLIAIFAGTITGNLTATTPFIDNFNGDIAVGSITASNNADGLAATEQNIVQTSALNAGAADKISPVSKVSAATTLTESGMFYLDGSSTAVDAFLNVLIDDNVAHTGTLGVTFTGTITIAWINLGDV